MVSTGMATVRGIPPVDVREDRGAGLGPNRLRACVDELEFVGGRKALGHRVIDAICDLSNRQRDGDLLAAFPNE